jgi:hypothetical protein
MPRNLARHREERKKREEKNLVDIIVAVKRRSANSGSPQKLPAGRCNDSLFVVTVMLLRCVVR